MGSRRVLPDTMSSPSPARRPGRGARPARGAWLAWGTRLAWGPSSSGGGLRWVILACLLLPAAGCGVEEVLREPFRGATPHERYLEALERSGLGESRMAREWARVAEGAFLVPVEVPLPFREEARFSAEEPTSLAYRFDLRRGQRLRVVLEGPEEGGSVSPGQVFVELFRLRDPDPGTTSRGNALPVAWTDPPVDSLVHEARTSSTYLLRIQPELLVEGRLAVELGTGPSMAFPVADRSTAQIGSRFGAPRDGGRREHHGVDVFAPRGTPVLAAGPGVVTRVRETPVGGRVVWVRDQDRGISRYYAHLDTQLVEEGTRVAPGDTLGTVGNTGNARTTPPHLHFGIYLRGEGPVDPWDFLHIPPGRVPELRVDPLRFGTRAGIRASQGELRAAPGGAPLAPEHASGPLRIEGGSGEWYRVRLEGGGAGYVRPAALETLDPHPSPTPGVASRLPPDPEGIGTTRGPGGS